MQSKPSLSVFTQLATSLVFDLGLNKPLSKDPQLSLCISSYKYPKSPTVRTMEERRAVLGCFLITSMQVYFSIIFLYKGLIDLSISSFLQKIDALRWTPHMGECLQVLDERQECLNDEILVQQIRLQLIVEKANQGTWNDGATETSEHIKAPLSFYSQALHSQLQEIKNKLSPRLQRNGKLSSSNYLCCPF